MKSILIGIALATPVLIGLTTYMQKNRQSLAANPFSLEEIGTIHDFDLKKPQFITASDQTPLAYYPFLPENGTKQVVIFYHGAGFHSNKTYQWVAQQLAQQYQIGCYLADIRGHGLSGGPRGDAPSIETVWTDISALIDLVRSQHPSARVHLAGHSSGAGLILNYANFKDRRSVEGYLLIAPYLGPQSGTLRENLDAQHSFAKKVRIWVYILNSLVTNEKLKHVTAIVFNYPQTLLEHDPLIVSSYTYTMSCATTPYDAADLFKKIDRPFSIDIGADDEQFLPNKVTAFKDQASLVSTQSVARTIPGARHLSILLKAPELIASAIEALQ